LVALYVVSAEGAAGKTAICAGLGNHFQKTGQKVGFLKTARNGAQDGDAAFMKRALALPEAAESLCLSLADVGTADRIKEAYDRIAQGKDLVIVEGTIGLSPDDSASQISFEIARALPARVIILAGYAAKTPFKLAESYRGFGDNWLGLVVNKVPATQLPRVRAEASSQCDKAGTKLLGVLPEDRALFTMTVAELVEGIQGKILNPAEQASEPIENFMLGAMVVDSGLDYFGRKNNKAVIIHGDRPDMQLAALDTATRCLVLSNSSRPPTHNVMAKAVKKGIPVILAEKDTGSIIAEIEQALERARFNQERKLPRLAELMRHHLDWKAIAEGVRLA